MKEKVLWEDMKIKDVMVMESTMTQWLFLRKKEKNKWKLKKNSQL